MYRLLQCINFKKYIRQSRYSKFEDLPIYMSSIRCKYNHDFRFKFTHPMSAKLEVKAIAKCVALQLCLAWIRLNRKSYSRSYDFMCAIICCNYFFFIDM